MFRLSSLPLLLLILVNLAGALSTPATVQPPLFPGTSPADSITSINLSDGVLYRRIARADGVVLHVLTVHLRRGVRVDAVKADDSFDGLEMVGEMFGRMYSRRRGDGDTVLAAVNGGPWDSDRLAPVGPLVVDGEVVEMHGDDVWSSFTIYQDGNAVISRDRLSGEIVWRGRRMPIASVNHRNASNALVLYNRYYALRVPGASERTDQEIIADAVSDSEFEDTGIDEPLDTAAIVHRFRQLRGRDALEHGSLKAELRRLPMLSAGWYGEPRVNDTMWATVGKIDTGVVEIPSNGYVISFGSNADWFSHLRRGDTVRLLLQVAHRPERVVHDVVPGYPLLISDGRSIQEPEVTIGPAGQQRTWERTGRTAVGVSRGRDSIQLVVVEPARGGRGGATSDELADIMLGLGSFDALCLDGRSASTMVVNEQAVTHDDGRAQRRVSSGLLVVKRRLW